MRFKYFVEYYTADIETGEYIAGYRDEQRFIELCKECPNFGNSWGCPPFDYDTEEFLRQFKFAHILATKVIPKEKNIPFCKSGELIYPERVRIESKMLELERKYDGRAFSYVGSCLHCGGAECRRKFKKPCLHPDKVRPSLEAYGFDIGKTLSELFGIQLIWGKDGILPDYLVIVSAIFHNNPL